MESYDRNHRQKKRGERFGQTPNPLKIERIQLGLTQLQVARSIGVTGQVIIDNEICLTCAPNPSYLALLASNSPTLVSQLSASWYAWRRARRADLSDPEGPRNLVAVLQTSTKPPESFSALITSATSRSLVTGTLSASNFSNHTRSFARMFLLQTSIVKSYLDSGLRWPSIAEALMDAGLSHEVVELLHQLPLSQNPYKLEGLQDD